MPEGMSIVIKSDNGELLIKAGRKTNRSYTWNGETISADLIPRLERWYGALGLYHPHLRPPHENVVHMIVQEYEKNFDSLDDALKWIKEHNDPDCIYRDDGLFTRFSRKESIDGKIVINILLIQILNDGKKPTKIPGSQNNKIRVYQAL